MKHNHDGSLTKSIDGTGRVASVTPEIAAKLLEYIKENYPNEKKILDVGAGQGFLQKIFEEDGTYEVWSVEGCSDVPFHADIGKRLNTDFSQQLDESYKKAFDLVTSFECIEHIHAEDQKKFWENIFYCADQALVTIHVKNQEDHAHCFIRNPEWWYLFFEESSIDIDEFILREPRDYGWDPVPRGCSIVLKLSKKE